MQNGAAESSVKVDSLLLSNPVYASKYMLYHLTIYQRNLLSSKTIIVFKKIELVQLLEVLLIFQI